MNPLGTRIGEISGQVVYLASGFNNVIATVTTNISGQTVKAEISGQTVVGSFTASVSGQPVGVSGEKIRLQAFDPSGATWRDLIVNQSGGNVLRVDAGAISVSSNISGQIVYLTSGQNEVQVINTVTVAGTVSTSVSGNFVNVGTVPVTTSVSGNYVSTSGSAVVISGQPVGISGQTITVGGSVNTSVSGNLIRTQAFDPSGNTWQDLWVSQSGGHDLRVNASVTANVSGQTVVAENSGQKIRLQAFDPSGNSWRDLWMNASGGNKLQVDASVTANADISGQTVKAEVSGQKIRLQGFDPSGNTWNDLIVNASGSNILRVDAGAIQVAANVSGNIVYLTSGQNSVQNSGQQIRAQMFDPSGNTWRDLWAERSGGNRLLVTASGDTVNVGNTVTVQGTVSTSISGNVIVIGSQPISVTTSVSGNYVSTSGSAVVISGQKVQTSGDAAIVSGQPVGVSGEKLRAQFFDPSGAIWRDAWVERSGGNRLLVTNSGDSVVVSNTVTIAGAVTTSISGQTVVSEISGQTITVGNTVPVTTSISGNYVSTSGSAVVISGQKVQTSGDAAVISGQPVGTSGQMTRAQFFDPSGAIWRDAWVERSGGNRLLVTASGDAYTISNTVTIAGTVTTSISGNNVVVLMSGGSMSGLNVITSGGAAVISGQRVAISGEKIRLQGFDPSGNTWNDLIVNASGSNILRVDVGSIQVSSNVSGNVVYLTSGHNDVQISGQTVNALCTILTSPLDVQGTVNTSVSGQIVYLTSGQNETLSNARAFDPSGAVWRSLWVERSGGNRLLATISGDSVNIGNTVAVTTSVSGNYVTVSGSAVVISGQRVQTSGDAAIISGQWVNVSGSAVIISGQQVQQYPWQFVRVPVTKQITSASGGAVLDSGIAQMVTIRNIGQSGTIMFVGYSGANNAPFVQAERSGRGFQLKDGDSITIPVPQRSGNMELIRVVSLTSGQEISYIGIDY